MEPFDIIDETTYRVLITKPIPMEERTLLPRDIHKFKGSFLRAIVNDYGWEAIFRAEPLPQ